MKKLIIIGNGPYARMMEHYIRITQFGEIVAYVVDKEYITDNQINGIKVMSFEQLKSTISPDAVKLIMGIGYTQMGSVRKAKFEQCKKWGYSFENYIHPTVTMPSDLEIGEGNNILENVIIEAGVRIGDANLFFGGCIIGHESIVGNFNTFSLRSVVAGCVQIANNCFLGAASTVKDHVRFEDFVLLGATAYGFSDMKEYSVVVPAKCEVLDNKKSIDYL